MQPVDRPILCNPYEEPRDHWIYDKETGAASHAGTRRPASYWYKTERTGSAQLTLTGLAEEERDDLPLVNALREDVRKWREAGYPGATNVTRELFRHWARTDRARRLILLPDRSRRDDHLFARDPVSGEGRHSRKSEARVKRT